MPSAVVYWLFNGQCSTPVEHGYVGVTVSWPRRLWRHRSEKASDFLPEGFEGKILFRGTLKQCLELEKLLRPAEKIGWNRHPGGLAGYAGKGVPKSPEHREKIRQAALARYQRPGERERTGKAAKLGIKRKGIDRSGAGNGHYGKHLSEESKQKIRDAIEERGGISGENNPNYRHGRYT